MKRRDFLLSSAGVLGTAVSGIARSAVKPCPPPQVSVRGGSRALGTCSVGAAFEPDITLGVEVTQYLTDDTGYAGPTKEWWHGSASSGVRGLAVRWKNQEGRGDWVGVDRAQGSRPFHTQAITSTLNDYKPVAVTELVLRARESGRNKGFYLRLAPSTSTKLVTFDGRAAANPPRLQVSTDAGSFDCPCICSAYIEPSSVYPPNGSRSFSFNSSSKPAIVQFDLSGIRGAVKSATMSLYLTTAYGSGHTVEVFEADPPEFQTVTEETAPRLGLAAEVGENKLASHPDVYMAGDFSGTTVGNGIARSPKLFKHPLSGEDGRIAFSSILRQAIVSDPDAPGTSYWRGQFGPVVAGSTGRQSFDASLILMLPNESVVDSQGLKLYPPANVVEDIYYRMYIFLESNAESKWSDTQANKAALSFDLRMGFWNPRLFGGAGGWDNVSGNGGVYGDGLKAHHRHDGEPMSHAQYCYHGHMQRIELGVDAPDGSPYANYRPLVGYNYHIDQGRGTYASYPSFVTYSNIVEKKIPKNRWVCIEQHLRMNSIDLSARDELGNGTARPDGLLQTWIDGILVDERNSYRWRHHPEMGIAQLNANWYLGGNQQSDETMYYRMNHLVAAKQYIGPRVKA